MIIKSPIIGSEKNIAEGIRVPTTVEPSQDFLLKRVKDYDYVSATDIKKSMELCDKLYQYEGTCGAAIDIFVEFAIGKLKAEETGIADLDKALDYFNKQVNAGLPTTLRGIQQVVTKISYDWFVKGNSFPYSKWDNIDVPDLPAPMKLPMRVFTLNPELIEIPKEFQMIGNAQLFFRPTLEMTTLLSQDGRSNPGLRDLKELLGKNKQSNQYGYRLNPLFVKQIKRKGRDYSVWGIPYLTRVFSAVASLRRLRRLDDATTEGLISLFTIFKIGDKDFPATNARVQAFSNLLRAPKPTHNLVWPHDVKVEQVGPDGKVLAFEKKYQEPRNEVLRALGVPSILLDPTASRGADPWASIIALAERLEKHRDEIGIWLEDLYHQIAESNGNPKVYPKVKWERMNLQNDAALKNFVMQFYDRGLIDPETALEESGYDFTSVVSRKKRHKTQKVETLFQPPQLPFGGTPQQKGAPQKGSPQDKKDKKVGTKPNVDQKTQKKPAKPKVTKVAAKETGDAIEE